MLRETPGATKSARTTASTQKASLKSPVAASAQSVREGQAAKVAKVAKYVRRERAVKSAKKEAATARRAARSSVRNTAKSSVRSTARLITAQRSVGRARLDAGLSRGAVRWGRCLFGNFISPTPSAPLRVFAMFILLQVLHGAILAVDFFGATV